MYQHLSGMCKTMQELADQGKGLSRDFFRELTNVKRHLGCFEKPKQELVGDIKKRVQDCDNEFKKRFCLDRPDVNEEELMAVPPIEGIDVDAIFHEPDAVEIQRAVMKLKNGKTTDMIGVQAEVLKAATQSDKVAKWFAKAVIAIWRGGDIPAHWLHSLGYMIWKKKNPKEKLKN